MTNSKETLMRIWQKDLSRIRYLAFMHSQRLERRVTQGEIVAMGITMLEKALAKDMANGPGADRPRDAEPPAF